MNENPATDKPPKPQHASDESPPPRIGGDSQSHQETPIAEQRTDHRQYQHGIGWPSWIQAISNAILVFVTACYAYYAWGQWQSLKETMRMTEKLVETGTRQSETARLAAEVAKLTADLLQADLRAWVAVREIVLTGDRSEGRPVDVKVFLINTGKTPARDLVGQVRVVMAKDYLARPEFAILSDDHPRIALAPGPTNIHIDRDNQRFPAEHTRQYQEGEVRIYVHGRIIYKDVFGVAHQTTFCAFHAFGDEQGTLTWCPQYNTID